MSWKNWVGNEQCSDCDVMTPQSLDELREIVTRAAGSGRRVRAAGGSYSWTPLVPNGDLVIRLDGLRRVLHFDQKAMTVEVESGITIEELTRRAAARDLTLISPTLFPKPTLGGAVSVGAHGTDFKAGGISDAILELKIVDHQGELRTVTRDDDDMSAAMVALGTLGVIY